MNTMKRCTMPALLALVTVTSCGPGSVAQAIRPEAQTASGAMGEGECSEVSERGLPLVVDWKSHDRGYLETTMRQGVAAMKYSCESFEILPDCKIDGSYGFTGYTRKEEVVRLRDADEIRTSLPLTGLGVPGGVGLELSRDSVIEIGTVSVGMYQTTRTMTYREEVSGPGCEGATHFVKAAFIGAFAMDVATAGKERTSAQLFGVGADQGSESARSERKKDGTLGSCKVDLEGKEPPEQCRALIRLELRAIRNEPIPQATAKASAGEAASKADTYEDVCPKGQVWADGKCTQPASGEAYQCTGENADECKKQCDGGHAGSCVTLARKFGSGDGVPRNPANAFQLFDKACKTGNESGCFYQGVAYSNGTGTAENKASARQLYEKACQMGSAPACFNAGLFADKGWGGEKNAAVASSFYNRGCSAGDQTACLNLGFMHSHGEGGLTQNAGMAASLYSRACEARNPMACANLAKLYWEGPAGVTKNVPMSLTLYERACSAGHGGGCGRLATILIDGEQNTPKDLTRGVTLRTRACTPLEDGASCVLLGLQYRDGADGVGKDPAAAAKHFELGCQQGQGLGCYYHARALERGEGVAQDAGAAKQAYEKGCALKSDECCKKLTP